MDGWRNEEMEDEKDCHIIIVIIHFFQGAYNPGETKFCFFDSLSGLIYPFLTDQQSNAKLPVGLQFNGLDLFFEIDNKHNFSGLVSPHQRSVHPLYLTIHPFHLQSIHLSVTSSISFYIHQVHASIHHYVTQVGYSMAYVSQNRSILRMPNTTVSLQGAFLEDLCKSTNTK